MKKQLYEVKEFSRDDITTDEYIIHGGLTKKQVMKLYDLNKDDFRIVLEDGQWHDTLYDYEIRLVL